jgi:hypothetical protein
MAQAFRNAAQVIGLSATDVYVCPPDTTAVVIGAQAANLVGSTLSLSVTWTDFSDGNAEYRLAAGVQVPEAAAYEPVGGKFVLEEGDRIRAVTSATNGIDLTVSVLELS